MSATHWSSQSSLKLLRCSRPWSFEQRNTVRQKRSYLPKTMLLNCVTNRVTKTESQTFLTRLSTCFCDLHVPSEQVAYALILQHAFAESVEAACSASLINSIAYNTMFTLTGCTPCLDAAFPWQASSEQGQDASLGLRI